jgi:hypothetical protein
MEDNQCNPDVYLLFVVFLHQTERGIKIIFSELLATAKRSLDYTDFNNDYADSLSHVLLVCSPPEDRKPEMALLGSPRHTKESIIDKTYSLMTSPKPMLYT